MDGKNFPNEDHILLILLNINDQDLIFHSDEYDHFYELVLTPQVVDQRGYLANFLPAVYISNVQD